MRAKSIVLLSSACLVGVATVALVAELSAPPAVGGIETQPQAATTTHVAPALAPSIEHRAQARVAATPLPAVASDPELTPREREQKLVARIDESLTERLRTERADPAWAPETESTIATTLAGRSFAGLRVDALKCGATMCRVSLHASEQVANLDAVIEELTTTPAFRHGGFVRMTSERDLTMFVARKGHPLPPPPRT